MGCVSSQLVYDYDFYFRNERSILFGFIVFK